MEVLKRTNRYLAIGCFLIAVGVLFLTIKYIYNYFLDAKNEKESEEKIKDFFKIKEQGNVKEIDNSYIAILEIPSILLRKGLVDKNSPYNNINQNIQILKESNMPNNENSVLILAAHSGYGSVSFFKKLDNVNISDTVNIFYNNEKYIYEVVSIYEKNKDGKINIKNEGNSSILVLTTCSTRSRDKQLVVVARLINLYVY